MMRACTSTIVLVAAALAPACDGTLPGSACDATVAVAECVVGDDPFACRWRRALTAHDDEAAWRRLLPALDGKAIVDGDPVPAPASFTFRSYPPHAITFPIDWSANPHRNRSWSLELQSLAWLPEVDPGTAAAAVVDWAERAMPATPALAWTWSDHAIAKRLDRVSTFFEGYARERPAVERRVVRAVARIVETHLQALATDLCYASHDNHGMYQDTAALRNLGRHPGLVAAAEVRAKVERRVRAHVARSVTDEGLHIEHSPDYQLYYLGLVLGAIDAFTASGASPPVDLVAARDRMLAATVHLIQPNLTFAQLGDTENRDVAAPLSRLLAQARRQRHGDPAALDQLAWVITRGAEGTPPEALDRVFARSGHAVFRERWDGDAAITGHFTCNRLSDVHYHKDETSFELYGHGMELIVDAGKYNYQYGEAHHEHQVDVFAHNVLTVDDASYAPPEDPRIIAHGPGWVQGTHAGYRDRAVLSQVRTFAYARPNTFVVVDHVRAAVAHRYAQRFQLAPGLTEVAVVDDRTVVASAPGGPSVVLVAEAPSRIELTRGWYYPRFGAVEEITVVVFRHDRAAGAITLPVVIAIGARGATPPIPTEVHVETRATTRVTWSGGAVEIPTP